MTIGASTSPIDTRGRGSLPSPFPRIWNSPPGIAAGGTTSVIWGRGLESLRNAILDVEDLLRLNHKLQQETADGGKHDGAVNTRHQVVGDDSDAAMKILQLSHRLRLPDVEQAE